MFRTKFRLTAAATVSLLALTLAGCSDSSDETAASSGTTETAAPADTAATETAETEATRTEEAAVEQPAAPVTPAVQAPAADGDVDMAAVLEPGPLKEMALGDENAPVTIVEYMSMTCPHCASFHADNFKPLVEKYVDTGKVRFILRE
ncbi:MAG: thioredoxin domain-containing protein, partial [Hoeflea sp.]